MKSEARFPALSLLMRGDIPLEKCGRKFPVDDYSLLKRKHTDRGEEDSSAFLFGMKSSFWRHLPIRKHSHGSIYGITP